MPEQPEIAVIGAGVVGLCTAIELIRSGARVSLFDRETPAKQTSFGNAGYLAAEYAEPLASLHNIRSAIALSFSRRSAFKVTLDHLPGFIPWALRFAGEARPTQLQHNREALRLLNTQVIAAWQELLSFADASSMMSNSGFMKLWEQAHNRQQALDMQATSTRAGFETELIEGPALFEREPALAPGIQLALLYPGAQKLCDPYRVCMKLFDCFQQHGGVFIQQAVNNLRPQQNKVEIQSDAQNRCFDQAVIACGAWSDTLLKPTGLSVPLAAERGYHLTLPEAKRRPQHILESVDRHVVLSSLQSGLRIVGYGEYGRLRSKPRKRRHRQLGRHLGALIRDVELEAQPVKTWMGIRPTLPDSLPVIDRHPKYPQIGMVFGHHHLGVTQAAISAKMIAAIMRKEPDAEVLRPFGTSLTDYSVSRFS